MSHLPMSLNQTVDKLVLTTFRLPSITTRHLIGSNTLQETDPKKKKSYLLESALPEYDSFLFLTPRISNHVFSFSLKLNP